MMADAPLFSYLAIMAPMAQVQARQTLAMALLPMGISVLLVAAMLPALPPVGLWICMGMAIGLMVGFVVVGMWARKRDWRGFSIFHFLVRYIFIALCPLLLWTGFASTLHEMSGHWPFTLLMVWLVMYPVGRILHEKAGPHGAQSPRLEMAHILVRQVEMLLAVFALMGLVSGVILEANRDYPTDLTTPLLLLWILGVVVLLASALVSAANWVRLFTNGRCSPPQPLDDPPLRSSPRVAKRIRFDTEKF
jgi:hypothetical protein